MMTSRPAKTNKQIHDVIQAECSRSSLSVPDTHDPNFSLISNPPTHPPHPHYRPCSLRAMEEWGFGLPRVMDGFHGEYEVRCEMPLARSSIFWGQMKMKRDAFKALRLHVPLRLRLGCVVSQMPGTNPLALPYLRYCRRHLSQCHSGGMWGRWMAEEVAIAEEDRKKKKNNITTCGKK